MTLKRTHSVAMDPAPETKLPDQPWMPDSPLQSLIFEFSLKIGLAIGLVLTNQEAQIRAGWKTCIDVMFEKLNDPSLSFSTI